MKKTLLLLLISAFTLSLSAQYENSRVKGPRLERVEMHPGDMGDYSGGVIGQKQFDFNVIGTTWYDIQTLNYGCVMRGIYAYDDGSIGATWTSAGQDGELPSRGIGYNYYNGTEWGTPDPHVGPEDRFGTNTYAAWGENGEIASTYEYIAGEGPIHFFRRETKGEGEWIQTSVNGPEGTSIVWHSMGTSGPDHEYIHLLAYTYDLEYMGQEAALLYYRSSDGAQTWDIEGEIIDGLGVDYLVSINALSYNFSNSVGNTIAFTYGFDEWGGWVFKSTDNGDSWTQITVMESPFDPFDPPEDTPIFGLGMGTSAVALDSQGKAHVVFPRMLQAWAGGDWGYYPLNSDGLIYWNEDMDPLDTTIISSAGLENLIDGGYLCNSIFGYDPSVGVEIPDGQPNYANALCGFPAISIDASDNLFVSSSNPTPGFISGEGYLYRHIHTVASLDGGATWTDPIDINDDLQFIFSECVFSSMSADIPGSDIYYLFQEDIYPGTYEWPGEQPEAVENNMYFITVPKSVFVGVEEHEAKLNFELSELYPNPTNNTAHFRINLENSSKVGITILNTVGQSVKTLEYGSLTSGDHSLKIDVSELPAGLYYANVIVDGQNATRKIVVN